MVKASRLRRPLWLLLLSLLLLWFFDDDKVDLFLESLDEEEEEEEGAMDPKALRSLVDLSPPSDSEE